MFRKLSGWTLKTLLMVLLLQGEPVAGANADQLRTLASAARGSLTEIVEPPVGRLLFSDINGRSEGAPIREYVLKEQLNALDALVILAATTEDSKRVSRILSRIGGGYGFSETDAQWLIRKSPSELAAVRLSASLEKLPEALHERMHVVRNRSFVYELNRKLEERPLGATALEDYKRLTDSEPDNPWHWLVLAWLEGENGEYALLRCLDVARVHQARDSERVQIFAWQQFAWLRRQQNRLEDAESAATEAVRMAASAIQDPGLRVDESSKIQQLSDLAQSQSALAIVLEKSSKERAAFYLLKAAERTQKHIVERDPEDFTKKYALMETLIRLEELEKTLGNSLPDRSTERSYRDQAWGYYNDLLWLKPFKSSTPKRALPGAFIIAVYKAGISTLLLGLVILWAYRRRVAQLMREATMEASLVGAPLVAPKWEFIQPASLHNVDSAWAQRWAAAVQVIAGFTFGIAAAFLILDSGDVSPNFNRVAILTWTWAWPTVLALILIWDGDKSRVRWAWGVYLVVALILSTRVMFSGTPTLEMYGRDVPSFVGAMYIFISEISHGLLLFCFLSRSVRSIGAPLLAMMLVVNLGGMIVSEFARTPLGLLLAVQLSRFLPVELFFSLLLPLAAVITFAWIALWVGRRLRSAYTARWISDLNLIVDGIWLFQAVRLSDFIGRDSGASGWEFGVVLFVLWKIIVLLGMWPAVRKARKAYPVKLLVLRVFSSRDKNGRLITPRSSAEHLFDLLSARCRYSGPIYLIGAPDLASTTITPEKFLDFIARKLDRRFIMNPNEVSDRMRNLDDRCDLDARWRISEFFCGNEAWRAAVKSLITRTDQVVMDLRGFGLENQGCLFELQSLYDLMPLNRVTLFVDTSTDMALLNSTLETCLSKVSLDSPNARGVGGPRVINVSCGERAAIDQFVQASGVA